MNNKAPQSLKKNQIDIKKLSFCVFLCVCMLVFIRLGFWQLSRAEAKKNHITQLAQRPSAQPLAIGDLSTHPDPLYYRVQLSGHYDWDHQFKRLDRIHQQRHGFEVLTPFVVPGSAQIFLVDRGFLPKSEHAKLLNKSTNKQVIEGVFYQVGKNPFLSNRKTIANVWPKEVLDATPAALEQYVGNLFPYYIQLSQNAPHSYTFVPKGVVGSPHKHYGYAIQWFCFALLMVIGVMIIWIKKN